MKNLSFNPNEKQKNKNKTIRVLILSLVSFFGTQMLRETCFLGLWTTFEDTSVPKINDLLN